MDKVTLLNEHGDYRYSFQAESVIQQHDYIHKGCMQDSFCDVDFIVKTYDKLIFLEAKKIRSQDNLGMNEKDFCKWLSLKFKDSLLLYWAYNNEGDRMPNEYVLLIEEGNDDKASRKRLRNKIASYLPLRLRDENGVNTIISFFSVFSIDELHKKYSEITIEKHS